MSFLEQDELLAMGFRSLGRNVRLSRHASIYGSARISIGDNTRIDDFCVLSAGSGGIHIGRNVHIAVMCTLIGDAAITLADFSGLSSRVAVYSSNDDYSGARLTNPTVPSELTGVDSKPVSIGRHCIVGCGSVLLPGLTMETGAVLGALSLAKGVIPDFAIYSGTPAKWIKARKRDLLELEHLVANP